LLSFAVGFLMVFSSVSFAAETPASTSSSAPVAPHPDDGPSPEMRAYLQLQEQLHATQLAVERNRKEAEDAAAQNSVALNNRLQALEQTLAATRARELDVVQSTNRSMLYVAGSFAAMGFVAMLLVAYFQWRTVSRLAEISAALPVPLDGRRPIAALGPGTSETSVLPALAQGNSPLMDTVERLEKRIHELEHPDAQASVGALPHANTNGESEVTEPNALKAEHSNGTAAPAPSGMATLLAKGQSLLNMDKPEEALACFDEALTQDPHHAEALVKRGTALERLRKLTEAIECYDRAIEADSSMTIAYLYKGGLFNRMERFSEALECYEKALRTQEKRAA
jgi:tetratricopeptide (TPR) repeat protein